LGAIKSFFLLLSNPHFWNFKINIFIYISTTEIEAGTTDRRMTEASRVSATNESLEILRHEEMLREPMLRFLK
jgi:hypothetical protein